MSVLKKVAVGLGVLVLGLVVVIALQPSEFRIERTAVIAAPAPVVFNQVNDLRKWEAWSPWAKLDPQAKTTYEGPPAGVGSSFSWVGNEKVGEGRMTITESRPSERVTFKLDFVKPFVATNTAEFTFKPEGNRTAVTWSMSGHNGFVAKAICLVMNMDKTVGGEFDKGLASMKSIAETAASR